MKHPTVFLKMIIYFASMLVIAHSKLLQSLEDTEAVVGENVTLKCRTDINDTRSTYSVEWRHQPVNSDSFTIVYKRTIMLNRRYEVVPNRSTGQYDLIIRNVQLSDAGRYTCEDRDSAHEAELIVFDKYPSDEFCTMTSAVDHNACGVETMVMSCDLSYRGNQAPTLEWLMGDNTILSTVKNNADGSITSSILLQKRQIETAKFTCRIRYPTSTTTSHFTWSPTMNNTLESTGSLSYGGCDHQAIECSDGKNPHCQYTWKDENGTEVSSSSSMQMSGKPNGNYTCFAACKVHQTSCSYVAKKFNYRCHEYSSRPTTDQLTSTTSFTETTATLESIISSPGITSPMIYITAAIAALVILIVTSLLLVRVFRRSACSDGTQDNQDKNGTDAEMGQSNIINNNNNNAEMAMLNGVKSQEADLMVARNTLTS